MRSGNGIDMTNIALISAMLDTGVEAEFPGRDIETPPSRPETQE